jgi:DNA-binding response OmpR family regulator
MSYRILLIDADTDSFERVQRPLSEAGYEIVVASDGAQAIEEFDRNAPDLAMVEAGLPSLDGFSVCEALKRHPSGKGVPVMILHDTTRSGASDDGARDRCGCDEYVEKPIDDGELLEICRRLLEDSKNAVDSTEETDGLLGKSELEGALGTLESIIDADPNSRDSDLAEKASARGDFSDLAAELHAMPLKTAQPTAGTPAFFNTESAETPAVEITPVEAAAETPFEITPVEAAAETPLEITPVEAAAETPFEATPVEATPVELPADSDGSDISSHLDAVFSSGLTSRAPLPPLVTLPVEQPSSDLAAPTPAAAESTAAPVSGVSRNDVPIPGSSAEWQSGRPSPIVSQTEAASGDPNRFDTVQAKAKAKAKADVAKTDLAQTELVIGKTPAIMMPEFTGGNRKLWPIVAALVVVVAGGMLALMLRGSGTADPTDTPSPPSSSVAPQEQANASSPATTSPKARSQATPDAAGATPSNGTPTQVTENSAVTARALTNTPQPTTTTKARTSSPKPTTTAKVQTSSPKPTTTTKARTSSPKPTTTAKAQTSSPKPTTTAKARTSSPKPTTTAKAQTSSPKPTTTAKTQTSSPPKPSSTTSSSSASSLASAPTATPATPAAAAPVPAPTNPIPLAPIEPNFSPKAVRKAAGQTVSLKVFVSETGKVTRVVVQEGQANTELVGAAMNAILRGGYEPATEKGVPVKGTVIEAFDF